VPTCTFCDASVPATASQCPACGAEQPQRDIAEASPSLEDELRGFLARGDKIGAIKRYRDATGAGLAEANHAVEAFASGAALAAAKAPAAIDEKSLEAEVLSALSRDGKIGAIKLYRERTKVGLKDAKDAVEGLAARHGVAAKGSGCAGMVLLLTLALAATFTLT
jgi:ribosomal protein L7/L12